MEDSGLETERDRVSPPLLVRPRVDEPPELAPPPKPRPSPPAEPTEAPLVVALRKSKIFKAQVAGQNPADVDLRLKFEHGLAFGR